MLVILSCGNFVAHSAVLAQFSADVFPPENRCLAQSSSSALLGDTHSVVSSMISNDQVFPFLSQADMLSAAVDMARGYIDS